MDLSYFTMLKNYFLNRDTYVVPEQAPLIILDSKSDVCMDKKGKDTKHTRNIYIRTNFVRNFEEMNLHKKVWWEGRLKLADIGNNNVREGELNPELGYDMVKIDNW